ncbi:hypothetical protein GQ42DRAFT_163707 [Ramicandelaber brevisporus]|nr:hypothetical protein GQ42DRAFT_163707 [Ramicandelaber brevisporus]
MLTRRSPARSVSSTLYAASALLSAVLLFILCFSSPVLASSSADYQPSANLQELLALSQQNAPTGILHLNAQQSRKYFHNSAQRDYGIVTIFTGLNPQLGCQTCQAFKPSFELVARGWSQQHKFNTDGKAAKVFFASIELDTNRDVFHEMGVSSVPAIYYFPPTTGPHAVSKKQLQRLGIAMAASLAKGGMIRSTYDFSHRGTGAEPLADFVESQVNSPVPVYAPFDYWRFGTYIAGGLFTLIVAIFARDKILGVLSRHYLWQGLSLVFVLVMCTGYMWNSIRNPSYMGVAQDGKPLYVQPGFSNQFAVETQIMAVLYGLGALVMIAMVQRVPNIGDENTRTAAGFVATAVFVAVYSLIVMVFRDKAGGYPYSLFL